MLKNVVRNSLNKISDKKLPDIKGIQFEYTTSLNRTNQKHINDFFSKWLPNSLPEFWLKLHTVNKCEINAWFSKVFPYVTEKLMIWGIEINKNDFRDILKFSTKTKSLHFIGCDLSSIKKPFKLEDKGYNLEKFYLQTTASDPEITVSMIVQSMKMTNIRDLLKKVKINGKDHPEMLKMLED